MTARLHIEGRVVDATTRAPLGGAVVTPVLGPAPAPEAAITDRTGTFGIDLALDPDRSAALGDGLTLTAALGVEGIAVSTPPLSLAELAGGIEIAVSDEVLERAYPTANLTLLGDLGPTEELEVGHSLAVAVTGLRPASQHTVTVRYGRAVHATQVLTSDQFGAIAPTVVVPQFGLVSSDQREPLTWKEAADRWDGTTIVVAVHTSDREVFLTKLAVRAPRQPAGFVSDSKGRLSNVIEAGREDLFVSLAALPKASSLRVFVVPRQGEWVAGDAILPAVGNDGRPLVTDAKVTRSPIRVAPHQLLAPGAYDLIVRPVRYGFEEDESMTLLARDIVIGRRHTGLIVRERWLQNAPILDGPVNSLQIAGSPIGERPYFAYRDTFAVGENVWAALDPGIVAPGLIGHKAAFYVISSKTPAQWAASTALAHVPPGQPPEVLLQSSCINADKTLVWAGANQVGDYDIVADFGNNPASPASFVRDDDFDASLDMIDGYLAPGFRVVRDPGTMTEFANVGGFAIDSTFLAAMSVPTSMTVADEADAWCPPTVIPTVNRTFERKAHVRFPADAPGATLPSQISTTRADYPLVVVVHGNGHVYTSYDFLLDHLAANGFVAMSIFMPGGICGLARANAFFDHLSLIRLVFGTKLANNVGVLGHSRGGEAVFKIARINHHDGLGIGLHAMFALAPTDQYGRETITGPAAVPLHVLYGAKDGDVSGWLPYAGYNVRQSGFSLYDRSDGADKSMTFVEDATHNGFVTANEASPAPLLDPADQHKILLAEANAFFRMHLRGEGDWAGMFTGEWRAPSVAASPAKTHPQFRSAARRGLDDFEGAHTVTSWQTSSAGGAVSQSGLPSDPIETQLYPQDTQSPHDTGGLRIDWDTTTDRLEFSIPPGQRDVRAFAALSFSVTRIANSAANPPSAAQNLRVALRDGAGHERSIRASAFGSIPVAAAANTAGNVKSAMRTIRIPLAAYVVVCVGVVPVDLADVVTLRFDFSEQTTGDIAVDNVEFTA